MSDPASEFTPFQTAQPAPDVMAAWLAQSHDLLALTDTEGRVVWLNAAFASATGLTTANTLLDLAPADWREGAARTSLLQALADDPPDDEFSVCLRGPTGQPLWTRARIGCVGAQRLWTLQDLTPSHALASRARHLSELLEMAQEFGRLGVWERDIQTGQGRWDHHVFGFFGMDPHDGTPDHAQARNLMHPNDRDSDAYATSVLKAGRYSRRYRVLHPDGGMRWIHSQWEVKSSPTGTPQRTIGIMMDDTEVYNLAHSLDKATAHLSLAAELGGIIIWRHDLKTGRVVYNERGYRILGLAPRSDGMSLAEVRALLHPDDVGKIAASARQALQAGEPVDVEARYRRCDNTWRTLLARRGVERDAAGEAIAFVGVSLDITEQAEQARHASQLAQRVEAAARAGRMGMWTTTLGADDTEWNAQMFELFDRVDRTRPPIFSRWLAECVHPDDAERVDQSMRRYARNQQGTLETEFRIRTRDGRTRWIVVRADVDRASDDHTRVFGIAMDVTEQREMLTALHAASARSALIAHHAGIGTWETDDKSQDARWDEQMFRLRGLAPRATPLDREERLALLHPDDRRVTLDARPDSTAGLPATAYEFRVRWPDGSIHWLASRSAPLRDAHGKVVRRVGVNWDITEARTAELARQQAQLAERDSQAKSQFLSRMSHELRTPLNAVLGFTQLLQADAQQAAAAERLVKLDHIHAAAEHLLTLINDALDLSSLESGNMKLDLQRVPLLQAVTRALPLVEALAAAGQVSLHVDEVVGMALADPTRLHQVLLNLLSNAIKYNRPGGAVNIDARIVGTRVRLGVHDTGRGMRPDQLAHLFEPFNRLGVEGDGIEGSGIGLTIARAMVERMGGTIGVSSEAGRGTLFEVLLPAAASADSAAPWPTGSGTGNGGSVEVMSTERPGRAGRLLYIEDNEVNVLLVEELVKSLPGLQFCAAGTGAAGVAAARDWLPDVVLIDLQLPDFDGFEVLRQLRLQPHIEATACIALSANAMPEDIARGIAAGFDDYWTKPIRFKPFLDALERLFPPDQAPLLASRASR